MRREAETRVLFDEPAVEPPLDLATAALPARMLSDELGIVVR